MKLDQRLVLRSGAAIILMAAVAASLLALKQARTMTDELTDARRVLMEQRRISERLEAELKATRTGADLRGLGQTLAEIDDPPGDPASDESPSAAREPELTPAEATEAAERSERMKVAVADAETLVETATRAGKWTEADRDRFHELLVDVEGPERRRLESGVGNLLVDGRLAVDADFVPL